MASLYPSLPLLLLFCGRIIECKQSDVPADRVINQLLDYLQCNTTSTSPWGDCPPWAFCTTSGHCSCRKDTWSSITCAPRKTLVDNCFCLTYDEKVNEYKEGWCVYSCTLSSEHLSYREITSDREQLTNETCGPWGRTGTLCGDCLPGHSLPAYSYQMTCIQCPHSRSNRWKLALIVSVSVTVFYVAIIIWRVRITAPDMYGFIFYAQLCSCPVFLRMITMTHIKSSDQALHIAVKMLSPFYSMWNLDWVKPFTQDFCLDLDPLLTLSLEYVVALYPLLLVLVTGFMVKMWENQNMRSYIRKCLGKLSLSCKDSDLNFTKDNRSLIDAYVAFFVLSLTKLCYVSFDLLIPAKVDSLHPNGSLKHYNTLYLAGTVRYLGPAHLPYAILAILMLTTFVICPATLLFLYPFHWFHRLVLSRLPHTMQLALHHFVDKFQGFYKNGTNGTRDYRHFSILHITLIFTLFIVYSILNKADFYVIASAILMLASFLYIFCQPFKKSYVSYTKTSSLLLLISSLQYSLLAVVGLTRLVWLRYTLVGICYLLALVPLVWMICSVAQAVYVKIRLWRKMRQNNYCCEEELLKDSGKVLYGTMGEQ